VGDEIAKRARRKIERCLEKVNYRVKIRNPYQGREIFYISGNESGNRITLKNGDHVMFNKGYVQKSMFIKQLIFYKLHEPQ